jgi:hypothetical protein
LKEIEMLFLHNSLNNDKFLNDKKLNLLKHGIITIGQFVNLIEEHDPYIMIGPAIVDKTKIKEFLEEWRNNISNSEEISDTQTKLLSQIDVIEKLDDLIIVFPEIRALVKEFAEKLKTSQCPKCTKNKYIMSIIGSIKPLINDGRDLGNLKVFVNDLMVKYYPVAGKMANVGNFASFDVEWIKPDEYIGLGNDLIEGLNNCFECTKKHIGRAKAFYEEFKLGYPDHEPLMFTELIKSNKALEEAFMYYSDSLAQLDMASCELVGDMSDLAEGYQVKIIELANEIRSARLLYQEDPTKVPNWDKLRLNVQKLQNKIRKMKK